MKIKLINQLDRLHKTLVKKSAHLIRKMPPVVVRILIAFDIGMAINPLWAWWLLYRYRGEAYTIRKLMVAYIQSVRFCLEYIMLSFDYKQKSAGFLRVDLFSPPLSEPILGGGIRLSSDKACGTCHNCCSLHWHPQRVSCPLLSEHGCTVYKGILWDYSNCGRYPVNREAIEIYQCPRFN
jgi:hypothetical protein